MEYFKAGGQALDDEAVTKVAAAEGQGRHLTFTGGLQKITHEVERQTGFTHFRYTLI